jgi:glycosyltransferase involved in cell wall biosynthesis
MKILLLTNLFPNPNFKTFGTYNYARAKFLKENGHEVKVICPVGVTPGLSNLFPFPHFHNLLKEFNKKRKIPSQMIYEDIDISYPKWLWLPKKFFWYSEVYLLDFFIGKYIATTIKSFKPDMILTSWLHPYGTYAKFFKQKFNIPVYSITEGSDILYMPKEYDGIEKIIPIINKYCDNLIFVSELQKRNVVDIYNIDNPKVINNGYDTSLFYYQKKIIDKGILNIISVGNLYPVKGHDLLLDAVCRLTIDYNLIIIGDGLKKDEYLNYIIENNLSAKVQLLAAVSQHELINYMKDADVCCMPSRSEGFSIAGLEALGCGIPLIATNVGGFSEIIIEGSNGFLIPSEDSDAIAEALTKAAITKWNNEEIAILAKENYSWVKWAKQIEDLHLQNKH